MPESLTRRSFIRHTARTAVAATALSAFPALNGGVSGEENPSDYDLIIKGGTLYDGTLSEPVLADIGIQADKIAAIGKLTGNAARTIDARGLIVTPGFIDVHTHCDMSFRRAGMFRYLAYVMPSYKGNHNYLYQGVTTVVTGNCGYGYTDTGDWLDMVDSLDFGSNVYHLAPHGNIRMEIFGQKQPRELSARQLRALRDRVIEEMEKGAAGLSTGLEYAPGTYATTEELIALCKVVRSHGGIYTTHLRDQTGRIIDGGKTGMIEALKEAVEIGRRAEIPVQVSHLSVKRPFDEDIGSRVHDVIAQARLDGLTILADQYPYAAGQTMLSARLPTEFKSYTGVHEKYKTAEGRGPLKEAVRDYLSINGPERIIITRYPERKDYLGKTLAAIAEMEGRDPLDLYVEMVSEEQSPYAIFFDQDIDVVRNFMPHDYVMTSSDGLTVPGNLLKSHPSMFGTFPR